ncbi:hypothetical protein A1O1_08554 [Capronia coronata CBS 617.96]|uniref:Uncharacterized protein n=1 Tax=Capronia coronata CBS 617.96 TaxID=1182541 RepID=W9YDM9_9EURO|nr:uncharacterized protein A1O1_08554 [Capronia coronata CBS 617.96]EXJ80409.1 hypothetical protein A1O1_08554 [Capronia coronata CBS 617.96]
MDFFRDGTVYIPQCAWPSPGHIHLLCRMSNQPAKSVCLAGDPCHDLRVLTGEKEIVTWFDETGRRCCMHVDIPGSRETLARVCAASRDGFPIEVRIVQLWLK